MSDAIRLNGVREEIRTLNLRQRMRRVSRQSKKRVKVAKNNNKKKLEMVAIANDGSATPAQSEQIANQQLFQLLNLLY